MKIIAIDPGPEKSGMLIWNDDRVYKSYSQIANVTLLNGLHHDMFRDHFLVIEMIASYGMPVGASVFETCVWIGRFEQEFVRWERPCYRIPFREVKMHFCHTMKAKEANVRQSLIDRYGGKNKAVGGKKCPKCHGKGWCGRDHHECPQCHGIKWLQRPGIFCNVKGHAWSALALALYAKSVYGDG